VQVLVAPVNLSGVIPIDVRRVVLRGLCALFRARYILSQSVVGLARGYPCRERDTRDHKSSDSRLCSFVREKKSGHDKEFRHRGTWIGSANSLASRCSLAMLLPLHDKYRLSGIGLQSVQAAKTLRVQAGNVIVTDGPFAETKKHLRGIVVLAFKDLNDAITSLSNHPALPFGVVIEIRPIHVEATKPWETQESHRSKKPLPWTMSPPK
jgi:YCII-related domain